MFDVNLPVDVLRQPVYEWLWNKVAEGKLAAKKINGKYEFYVPDKYIKFKHIMMRELEDKIEEVSKFYLGIK